MLLKSLVLQSFKSFADKTVIEFNPGVTGIVGPNGCGKSNVVDAIKWVLGETSAKALRGGEMADVIFNGTDKRQRHSMAEVTLTFSDCEKSLGVDYNEIAITRRVYRDGKGEYALNGTPCRLRDINELFMDTGIGQSAYSIMEQGKIDQLLSSKPEDRRAVFEEAAGITKFKTQKREALRKLEYTEANLLRLTDIIAELKRQMATLQRQAAKARRYQEILHDTRVLDTHASHRRYVEWSAEKSELDQSISSLTQEIDRLTEEASAHETQLEEVREELEQMDAQLAALRAQAAELSNRKHSAESRIGFNGERTLELESLITKSQEEIAEARQRLAEQEEDLRKAEETLTTLAANVERQQADIEAHEAKTRALRDEREALERELRDLRRQSHQSETTLISSNAALTSQQQRIESDANRCAELENEMRKLIADREEREKEEQRILAELAEATEQREAQEEVLQRTQDELRQTQVEYEAGQKRYRDFHKAYSEKKSRLEVLEQLLARGEGLEKGTQEVLRGFTTEADPSPKIDLSGVHGLLSSYLEVEPAYVRAIEAALGYHLQTILVADQQLAETIIDTLTRGHLGEAVVLPENFLPPELPRQLSTLPDGSQAWAADKVRVKPPAGPLIDHLLGNVLIVPDLATALRLRKVYGDLAFATQNGEFISAQGVIRGGRSTAETTSLLQRQNEIKQLQEETMRGEDHLLSLENSMGALGGLVAGLQEQLADAAQLLHQFKLRESELSGQLSLVRKEIAALNNRHDSLERECQHLKERRESLMAGLAELTLAIETAQSEMESQALRLGEVEQSLSEAMRREAESSELLNELRRNLALEIQAAESLRRQREPMTARLRELSALIERREAECAAHQERITAAHEENERLQVIIAECQAQISELEETIAAGQAMRSEKAQQTGEIERALSALRRQAATLAEQRGREEVKSTQLSLRLENLLRQVSERYQTSLEGFEADYHTLLRTLTHVRAKRTTQEKRRATLEGRSWEEDTATTAADAETPSDVSAPVATLDESELSGLAEPSDQIDWDEVERFASELRQRLDSMGPVNLDAIQEYEELEERHTFLEKEHTDLTNSKTELLNIIQKINVETRRMFAETFEQIRQNFQRTFKELFGNQGFSDLVLSSDDDPLEAGIEVIAKPPGKKPTSISLLSGGERSMTAVALLFSIYMVKPSPFCVLDELDAPLDEANIGRFLVMLDKFIDKSQFVIVTHNKKTMRRADVIYGISMEEPGVSKPVHIQFKSEHKTAQKQKRETNKDEKQKQEQPQEAESPAPTSA